MPKVGHIILFFLLVVSAVFLGREAYMLLSGVEAQIKTTAKEASVVNLFPRLVAAVPTVKIRDLALDITLADTAAKREQGLSSTPSLATSSGMLFVFSKPGRYPFWMKDMNYSLDIIWIGRDHKIVDITKNLSPNTYPESIAPIRDTLYVLEINAGLAGKYNLKIGDKVSFSF